MFDATFDAAYEKFRVGHKDTAVDKNGLIMAAIQSLHKKIREQERTLTEQEARLREQERIIGLLSK
uniref:Uncharacterized protein n=1 Tax=Candidatus Kentrum sp. DK TaxID=2126562 RepID=A0A450SGQ0_9GAMM|nr:MAG: hypothetical protein BECKDK2373B_GA0170837_103611 [Candidatus Kentron sp. DK]